MSIDSIESMGDPSVLKILGPTILLGSGTYFDFDSPETSDLTIEDVAWGLAFTCRFSGQCVSQITGRRVFYSVAEHCVRMSFIVSILLAYDALMHELGEATCGDMTKPLKVLCPEFSRIENRCQKAGQGQFGVTMRDPAAIKVADRIMLATEQRDLMPCRGEKWTWTKGAEPLPDRIVPWTAEFAANAFLERYHELRSVAGA